MFPKNSNIPALSTDHKSGISVRIFKSIQWILCIRETTTLALPTFNYKTTTFLFMVYIDVKFEKCVYLFVLKYLMV